MLRFFCKHPRALIPTPSRLFMPPKSPCTEIPIQNANISTLDPHNFFLAWSHCTKFKKPLFRSEFSLGLKPWTIISLCKFGQKISTPPLGGGWRGTNGKHRTVEGLVRRLQAGQGPHETLRREREGQTQQRAFSSEVDAGRLPLHPSSPRGGQSSHFAGSDGGCLWGRTF